MLKNVEHRSILQTLQESYLSTRFENDEDEVAAGNTWMKKNKSTQVDISVTVERSAGQGLAQLTAKRSRVWRRYTYRFDPEAINSDFTNLAHIENFQSLQCILERMYMMCQHPVLATIARTNYQVIQICSEIVQTTGVGCYKNTFGVKPDQYLLIYTYLY